MIIDKGGRYYPQINVEAAEGQYSATYICDLAILGPNKCWNETPVMVFYQPNPDVSKGHSHYFGLFPHRGGIAIVDAASVAGIPMLGIVDQSHSTMKEHNDPEGVVVFSRFKHDYVPTEDHSAAVDGGRNYIKRIGLAKEVWLVVEGPDIMVIDDPHPYFVQHKLTWGTR